MTRKKKVWLSVLLLVGGSTLPACLTGCSTSDATAQSESGRRPVTANGMTMQPGATYNAQGELIRPAKYREWIFIGAPVTPNDMNEGHAAFPEFHNVYIDPASYATYQRTGRFAEGTVILKELVSVGSKKMDSGHGYFQGEFVSLEAMVKDTTRFRNEPGGWAFFRFGDAPDYAPVGARMKTESCNACHSGANEDYVFTATYPVLRAARPRMTSQPVRK